MLFWIIQSRPDSAEAGPTSQILGQPIPTLMIPESDRGQPLRVAFDDVARCLIAEPGVYWEPDGTFSWIDSGPSRCRLLGQLADGGEQLQHVEIRGIPSARQLDRLIDLMRGDGGLMFQLVEAGVYVEESALRQLAK